MMGSSSFSSSSSFASDLEAGYAPPLPSPPRAAMRSRSPRATLFCDGFDDDEPRHFLDSCFLCRKPLPGNRDIFMYRGDMPFCSVECRQDQIEMDEGSGQNWKLSLKASSRKDANKADTGATAASADAPPKSHKVHVSTGTAVAAG